MSTARRYRFMSDAPQTRERAQRGSTLVETALVITFLLMPLFFVTLDFGRWFYYSIEIQNAAQAAAQYGAQNISDGTGITSAATTDAADLSGMGVAVAVGCECPDGSNITPGTNANPCSSPPSCSGGASGPVDYVQVQTSATYTPVIPWTTYIGAPASITLKGEAWMRTTGQ
jgi:Flp pilus assembly protein TadG